jgi:rRNA-processing protein FCF1
MKKLQQSVKAKLVVTPNVAGELKATMREFAKAFNLIVEVKRANKSCTAVTTCTTHHTVESASKLILAVAARYQRDS